MREAEQVIQDVAEAPFVVREFAFAEMQKAAQPLADPSPVAPRSPHEPYQL